MMILPPRPARRWIAPVAPRPRLLLAALLLAAASLVPTAPCSAATNASTDAATSPLSVRDQLNQDRTDSIEPYLYGLAIAGAICAWKFRQKRRVEQVLV
jgi:hypothetical protein